MSEGRPPPPPRAPRRRQFAVVIALLFVVGSLGLASVPTSQAATPAYPPLTGTVIGPSLLGVNGSSLYRLNATGGPAFALNGTQIGILNFTVSVLAGNSTGVSVLPNVGALSHGSYNVSLSVGPAAQTVVLQVEYSSMYRHENVSINVTYAVQVVHPYILTGLLQAGNTTVAPFQIQVSLDGALLAPLSVPTLTPHQEYNFTYRAVVAGLSPGDHTFVLTLPTQHGQVHFAGGALTYAYTFSIPGPAPDYTLYYVLGSVALVGVILIFLILVGARRRGGSRS